MANATKKEPQSYRVAPTQFPADLVEHPNAVYPHLKEYWDRLRSMGCILADGYREHFQNKGDTLVFLIPNKAYEGHDLQWLLFIFTKMRPDEISLVPCVGRKGFGTMVRMWYD